MLLTFLFGFRYYAIASPSATQRLLLGLLEAPPSWAPDALDAAVQLVELLRAAEDYATGMRVCSTFFFSVYHSTQISKKIFQKSRGNE